MISWQNSPEEEAELKKLKEIEKSVEQTAKKLDKVDGELTGLRNVSVTYKTLLTTTDSTHYNTT